MGKLADKMWGTAKKYARKRKTPNFLSHLKEGAFTDQAKAAGMSVQEFAAHVQAHPEKYSGTTRKRASFAKTVRSWKH
jgi:hypothetical protein